MRKSLLLIILVAAFAAGTGITAAASPLETLMGLTMGEEATVPIIMYHVLEDTPDNVWEITFEEFEADLKYLAENGFTTVIMQDLIDFVHHGKRLPEKPIVLSFDDGRSPTAQIILPLLEKYNAKITMAIIGVETDRYTEIEKQGSTSRHPHMTWDEVVAVHNTGLVEIQCHTYDLHGPNGAKKNKGESEEAYRERLLTDLHKFSEKLQEYIGITSNTLVYPLGAISSTSDDIIKEAGYLASLSCHEKNNIIVVGNPDSLYSLRRYLRPPHKSSGEFFARLSDNKMMNE